MKQHTACVSCLRSRASSRAWRRSVQVIERRGSPLRLSSFSSGQHGSLSRSRPRPQLWYGLAFVSCSVCPRQCGVCAFSDVLLAHCRRLLNVRGLCAQDHGDVFCLLCLIGLLSMSCACSGDEGPSSNAEGNALPPRVVTGVYRGFAQDTMK